MKIHEKDEARKNALVPLAKVLNNVSAACRILGFSRDTFYRALKSPEKGDASKTGVRKTRMQSKKTAEKRYEVENMIISVAKNYPSMGKRAIAKIISESGNYISASKVYSVIKKSENLNSDREECTVEKKTTLKSNPDSGRFCEIQNLLSPREMSGRKSNRKKLKVSN